MIRLLLLLITCLPLMAQDKNTLFKDQWYLKNSGQSYLTRTDDLHFPNSLPTERLIDINWLKGEKLTSVSSEKIIVAVIDVGIDYNHPDLKGRIWINTKKCTLNK